MKDWEGNINYEIRVHSSIHASNQILRPPCVWQEKNHLSILLDFGNKPPSVSFIISKTSCMSLLYSSLLKINHSHWQCCLCPFCQLPPQCLQFTPHNLNYSYENPLSSLFHNPTIQCHLNCWFSSLGWFWIFTGKHWTICAFYDPADLTLCWRSWWEG